MTPRPPFPVQPANPREDVLVSVCFGDLAADGITFDALAGLAAELDARFRFREIIVVAEESRRDAYLPLVRRVANLRLFTVRDGTAFYRRRVIAAEEAIGDVVLVASATELASIDPVGMVMRATDEQCAVLATRGSRVSNRSFAAPLAFLGRAAGFQVRLRDLQTLAVPRTLLNHLLAHPDPDLALRFPPRDVRVPLVFAEIAPNARVPRDAGFRRRVFLLQKLLVYLAPSLLMAVTLSSALLAALGFLYGLYVLGAWMVLDVLAPGWLTLSSILSLTAFFLGVSVMGVSLGLQQLLSRTYRDSLGGVASEVNQIDLFGNLAADLNVDFERDRDNKQRPPSQPAS